MGLKHIQAYQTEDGKIFSNINEASQWRNELRLKKELLEDPLYPEDEGYPISLGQMRDWLLEHKEAVLYFLNKV